jgi:tetratricopeptide (TPR) repeat protein
MGELSLPNERRKAVPLTSDLEGAQIRFEDNQNACTASELLVASVVRKADEMAYVAANCILKNKLPVIDILRIVAINVLTNRANATNIATDSDVISAPTPRSLKLFRQKTRLLCSDAIAWIELALAYTTIGKKEKALRAVKTALQLAPNNRFIIRSTIRCLLHCREQEAAYDILSRHGRTKRDPWLLASQLAVAEILSKPSHLVSDARDLLQSRHFHPVDLAELSASLATTELFAGNDKRAKRLFQQSLTEVTENALAQIIWAKNHIRLNVELADLTPPRNFEAEARCRIRENNWTAALTATLKWRDDEPFSGRPAELATFITSVVEEDFPLAERIAIEGLIANPDHSMLLNNLAFAQACQGKLQNAKAAISKIVLSSVPIVSRAAVLATKGLILFREGDLEGGRNGYKAAMDFADEHKLSSVKTMAMIFLAREEWRANSNYAQEAVRAAEAAATGEKFANVLIAADRLSKYVAQKQEQTTIAPTVTPSFVTNKVGGAPWLL